jgi:hypothetical protein
MQCVDRGTPAKRGNGLASDNESQALNKPTTTPVGRDSGRFFKVRQRVYTGLLLLVVIIGLPIVTVPRLRNRLSTRILALKTAMAGNITPAVAQVGANLEPFPAEYEKPEPPIPQPPRLPSLERVFTQKPPSPASPSVAAQRSNAPKMAKAEVVPPALMSSEESTEATEPEPAESTSTEPNYQTGKIEQEAYELVLQSNVKIAEMVKGSDPALHFKSWGAVSRGNDIYWVRLKFQSEKNSDLEYIWQVKLQTKEVTPLSYNARTIS